MYARFSRWVGDKPWFRPIARRALPTTDKLLAKLGWRATPWPTLLLTTKGRRTGRPVDAPLYFVEQPDGLAVIATNYGNAEPDWSLNLRHDSSCTIKVRRRRSHKQARLADSAEWEPIFERFAGFYPGYRAYRQRAHRDIPIWILS